MQKDFPVLLVEDDPVSRKIVEKILFKNHYPVVSVTNGVQALAKLKEQFFPILITDWEMPEMNGLELCRRIRKMKTDGYVFIILLTGRDSKDDLVEGLDAGADDYVIKPLNAAELVARLNTGVRILKLERSLRQANQEIRKLSITDSLTGCYNRGYMQERLPQEIRRAQRYGRPLSMMICDIDHFKQVNDRYGHQAGDEVLKAFVACILGGIRDGVDWLARYGGEEFVVVLPETDAEGGAMVAERLRSAVQGRHIVYGEHAIAVTASFGVTGVPSVKKDAEVDVDALIAVADRCMYEAKEQGRNRVIVSALNG